jgi:hypothetical protein
MKASIERLRRRLHREMVALCLLCGIVGFATGALAANTLPHRQEGRLVVGLKKPLTPLMMRDLNRLFPGRVVSMPTNGTYVLLLLSKGQTPLQVQKKSPLILFVEPEITMGIPGPEGSRMLLIASPGPEEER